MTDSPCTCHPDDSPPQPCPKKYALGECRAASPLLRPYQVLRAAVDAMMAPLGYHGTISARDDRVQAVMDALSQIDEVERAREALT